MLANHTDECVGGPHDGKVLTLPPGARHVEVMLPAPMRPHDYYYGHAAFQQIRTACYELRRHPRLGYALYWQLPTG